MFTSYFCFFNAFTIFSVLFMSIMAVIMFDPRASFSSMMLPINDPINEPSVKNIIFKGSFFIFVTVRLVDRIHIIEIIPCNIAPSIFFPLDIIIILSVDRAFSNIFSDNIIMYVILYSSILLCLFLLFLILVYNNNGDWMKKFLFVLFLCGCTSTKIDDTIDKINDVKLLSYEESIRGYVSSIDMAYYNYLLGSSGDILVNVDGSEVFLDIQYNGTDISCLNINIINGDVGLDDCLISGYSFSYNGDILWK